MLSAMAAAESSTVSSRFEQQLLKLILTVFLGFGDHGSNIRRVLHGVLAVRDDIADVLLVGRQTRQVLQKPPGCQSVITADNNLPLE